MYPSLVIPSAALVKASFPVSEASLNNCSPLLISLYPLVIVLYPVLIISAGKDIKFPSGAILKVLTKLPT